MGKLSQNHLLAKDAQFHLLKVIVFAVFDEYTKDLSNSTKLTVLKKEHSVQPNWTHFLGTPRKRPNRLRLRLYTHFFKAPGKTILGVAIFCNYGDTTTLRRQREKSQHLIYIGVIVVISYTLKHKDSDRF
jgi:hypothetical protein